MRACATTAPRGARAAAQQRSSKSVAGADQIELIAKRIDRRACRLLRREGHETASLRLVGGLVKDDRHLLDVAKGLKMGTQLLSGHRHGHLRGRHTSEWHAYTTKRPLDWVSMLATFQAAVRS